MYFDCCKFSCCNVEKYMFLIDAIRSQFLFICYRFTDLNHETISVEKLSPQENGYKPILAYNQSKLCNILFANELNRRLGPHRVYCNSVHPGNVICTGISRHWWFWRLLYTLVRPFAKSKVTVNVLIHDLYACANIFD